MPIDTLTGRVYLRAVNPKFQTPRSIAEGRFLLKRVEQVQPLGDGDDAALRDSQAVIDVFGIEPRIALQHLLAVVTCFHLASRCTADIRGYWVGDVGFLGAPGPTLVTWGHYTNVLEDGAIAFADRHYPAIEATSLPERFSRVSNALRLYTNALSTQNADLALLGFVGSLESLFAVAPQELSFRLSLLLARFLGEDPVAQRAWFNRVRDLYTVRSKLAHGDKIADSEEAAAVQIVDQWTPGAEELARLSICRLLDLGLIDLFNSKNRHDSFLTNLVFIPTLKEAIAAT